MKITKKLLKHLNACNDQVELFENTFGQSAKVTMENCFIASDAGLQLWWLALSLFSRRACKDFESETTAGDDTLDFLFLHNASWQCYVHTVDMVRYAKVVSFYKKLLASFARIEKIEKKIEKGERVKKFGG